MNKSLPDKWVRKAIFTLLDGITVDSNTINCYDFRTGNTNPSNYILIQGQTNETMKPNKCEYRWRHTVLLDIYTRRSNVGNTSSRLLADEILDSCRNLLDGMTLDVASGMTILTKNMTFPTDITTEDGSEIVHRKFLRFELTIN